MDNATRKLMTTDRCGMKDFTTTDRVKRRRRYRKHGAKWSKKVSFSIPSEHKRFLNVQKFNFEGRNTAARRRTTANMCEIKINK